MGTYLNRTPSSAGNRGIWTVSCWIKKSNPTHRTVLFGTPGSDNNSTMQFILHQDSGVRFGVNSFNVFTTTNTFVMRDPSSWYHLVLSINTSEGSSDNRTKFYINGERFTNFDGNNLNSITNGFQYGWNNTIAHTIGAEPTPTDYMDGYITNFVNIDGQALGPSSFGETDSTTGEWKPKADLSGLTFGTNGFWQKYESAGNLGLDSSGNSNTYTVNNAGTGAQTVDTASNNFCTFNPLANRYANSTFTLGNLAVAMGASQSTFNAGTFGVSSGKWYFEMKPTALGSGTDNCLVGIVSRPDSTGTSDYLGEPTSVIYRNNGNYKKDSGNATYGASWTTSDIVMVAFDCDNNNIYFGTNGNWANGSGSNNQASPSSAIAFTNTMITEGIVFPAFGDLSTNAPEPAAQFNFGNPPFSISSGNADANGFGNFEYAVPSGYYALCTKNINSYG
jgi:hypothetical protein